MLWPVESGRVQPSLDGRKWSEVHPFAGPAVIVAGPDEKIGEMFPISFDLLRWGTPVLGILASGEPVIDRKDSHVASHAAVFPLLAEAFSHVQTNGRDEFCEEVDFCRIVGETICVATSDADEIVYAKRPSRRGLTRFVKNRDPESTSSVTACFKRTTGGAFLLMTAFIGSRAPAEPWDTEWADEQSVPFWNSNALIWGAEEVIADTETSVCPW